MTGAAGQIAYSLLYSIARGDVFGKDQVRDPRLGKDFSMPVEGFLSLLTIQPMFVGPSHLYIPSLVLQSLILVLLDITPMMAVLDGVLMELQDCALPLLTGDLNELVLVSEAGAGVGANA